MAIVSRHIYLRRMIGSTPVGARERYTIQPIPVGQQIPADGFPQNTNFEVTATNIDGAGWESEFSDPTYTSTLLGLASGGPMLDENKTFIDNTVAAARQKWALPGIMVTTDGYAGKYEVAQGSAGGRALTIDDFMRIGSTTKIFTGVCIWRLIDQGKLKLTDKLGQFIEGFVNGDKITIEHMLMMKSGIWAYDIQPAFQQSIVLSPTGAYSDDAAIAAAKAGPSMFEPGEAYQYTNINYILAGRICELLDPAKRTIRQIIEQDIINVIGCADSIKWPDNVYMPEPYARGYGVNHIYNTIVASVPLIGALIAGLLGMTPTNDQTLLNPGYTGPSGVLVAKPEGVHKFAKALYESTFLSAKSELYRRHRFDYVPNHAGDAPPDFYAGFGYGVGVLQIGEWIGHPGTVPGYECACMFNMNNGAVITAQGNFQTSNVAVLGWVFAIIADHLYPGSIGEPVYLLEPDGLYTIKSPASTKYGATAMVSTMPGTFESNKSPASTKYGATEMTGGVTFVPYAEKNIARTNQPVPAGLTEGMYIRICGTGQRGYPGGAFNTGGGQGGSGGDACDEYLIPASELAGLTYSTQQGIHGTGYLTWGTDTFFKLSDGREIRVKNGKITVTGFVGVVTRSGSPPGGNNTVDAGPGGGNGGPSLWGYITPGTKGGDSVDQPGGVSNASVYDPHGRDGTGLHAGSAGTGGLGVGTTYGAAGYPGGKGGTPGAGSGGGGSGWDTPGVPDLAGDGLVNVRLV